MAQSNFSTQWDIVSLSTAGAAQTMNVQADAVLSVYQIAGGATSFEAAALTVVTGAPGSGEVQFTGTPGAPSNTLTLEAAPADAGGLAYVQYIPAGTIPNA